MNSPKIYIVGSGVLLGKHFTGETIEALKVSRRIFTIIQEDPLGWLPGGVEGELIDIFHLYEIGGVRKTNYDRVVNYLLDSATSEHPISYLTYGNPVVFDSVAQGLLSRGKETGVKVQILPSVSSIDTILADLGRDMAPGLQIYESSFLVCCEIEPRTDVPCILLQLGVFGTSFATYDKPGSDKMHILVEYLLRYYPESHDVFLVNSQTSPLASSSVFRISIAGLKELNNIQSMCQSAYLPSLRNPIPNQDFMELMNKPPYG